LGRHAATARADGDPASDVLATQKVFLPLDANVSAAEQAQLAGLLAVAERAGYGLRVAVIASSADLGSVTALWGRPGTYARFLGQELALVYRGPLLVVMPGGYGLYGVGAPLAGDERSALSGLGPPGGRFGFATVNAVRRLAAGSGHPLPVIRATAPPDRASSSHSALVSWVILAAGAVLIVVAWTSSLHAKPLRPRRLTS
jgi:hypothetical protein